MEQRSWGEKRQFVQTLHFWAPSEARTLTPILCIAHWPSKMRVKNPVAENCSLFVCSVQDLGDRERNSAPLGRTTSVLHW